MDGDAASAMLFSRVQAREWRREARGRSQGAITSRLCPQAVILVLASCPMRGHPTGHPLAERQEEAACSSCLGDPSLQPTRGSPIEMAATGSAIADAVVCAQTSLDAILAQARKLAELKKQVRVASRLS